LPSTARTLVASLRGHGVDRVFCVAGESYLPVLDALYDTADIDVVTCRQEGSAGFMALADAKLTRRAGVCLASRGPGAANAAIAVHAAAEDATPLVLFVGGVATGEIDREVFQELDCGRTFGSVAKAVWTLHDPGTAGELVTRAFLVAESGTPGPVVVSLPEDVLGRPDPAGTPTRRVFLGSSAPCGPEVDRVQALLANSRRPLLLAGARLDTDTGRALLRDVAELHQLPVLTSNKNQHLLPNRHPNYAGHLHNATPAARLARFNDADLVLAIGTRLDSVTTRAHRFPASPDPDQPLVHVYPDAARIGRYHRPEYGFAADPAAFLRQVAGWAPVHDRAARTDWLEGLHRWEAENAVWRPVRARDGVVFGAVVSTADELTGGDAVVVVDSGTFTSWVYRYLRFGERGRLLGISSSAMGFSVGAGVSAALRAGGVPTVVFVGDGGLLMNAGDLATACDRRLPVVFVVANNRSYGTIRLHQERTYPNRVIATTLANPDFARMAEAFGALGLTVHTDEQVGPCLAKALEYHGPAVVEVRTSLEHITAYRRLTEEKR
jgi:acetolactate synthase-1/2/3 large subunit